MLASQLNGRFGQVDGGRFGACACILHRQPTRTAAYIEYRLASKTIEVPEGESEAFNIVPLDFVKLGEKLQGARLIHLVAVERIGFPIATNVVDLRGASSDSRHREATSSSTVED